MVRGLQELIECGQLRLQMSVSRSLPKLLQNVPEASESRTLRREYSRLQAAYCNEYKRIREANRARLREYLTVQQCMDCGICDLAVLEFGHRDPTTKGADVSAMVQKGFAWTTILREMDK